MSQRKNRLPNRLILVDYVRDNDGPDVSRHLPANGSDHPTIDRVNAFLRDTADAPQVRLDVMTTLRRYAANNAGELFALTAALSGLYALIITVVLAVAGHDSFGPKAFAVVITAATVVFVFWAIGNAVGVNARRLIMTEWLAAYDAALAHEDRATSRQGVLRTARRRLRPDRT